MLRTGRRANGNDRHRRFRTLAIRALALSVLLVPALAGSGQAHASGGSYFVKQLSVRVSDALAFMWEGPDGDIWFTEFSGNAVGRVTPRGSVQEYALAPPANGSSLGNGPGEIKTGPGGLWFAEFYGNKIGNINPWTGTITEFPVPSGSAPHEIDQWSALPGSWSSPTRVPGTPSAGRRRSGARSGRTRTRPARRAAR